MADTLTITDNRTGKQYEIPVADGGVIRATDLRQIKSNVNAAGSSEGGDSEEEFNHGWHG